MRYRAMVTLSSLAAAEIEPRRGGLEGAQGLSGGRRLAIDGSGSVNFSHIECYNIVN